MDTQSRDAATGRMISLLSSEQRFWLKVEKTDNCWLFRGGLTASGYGNFWTRNAKSGSISAHRFSYELANGPIPAGTVICHTCDVRNCVNPAHLFAGTYSDNAQDMITKGRQVIGHRKRKLTPDQVRDIRSSHLPYSSLTIEFGISYNAIFRIKHRQTYKDID